MPGRSIFRVITSLGPDGHLDHFSRSPGRNRKANLLCMTADVVSVRRKRYDNADLPAGSRITRESIGMLPVRERILDAMSSRSASDFVTIEQAIDKGPLIGWQIEQKGESDRGQRSSRSTR